MKNFLLYLGNDRAGSTWLHGELSKRSDCAFPVQKEMFIFQKWFPVPYGFDKETYFDLMAELAQNPAVSLVGDITPSNAYATKDQLYWYKENLAKYSLNVLPVMTLRDPISHTISISKLQLSANDFAKKNSPEKMHWFVTEQIFKNQPGIDPSSVQEILEVCRPPFEKMMIPWRETVENAIEVFGKIHFNFYETLFTEESIEKLFEYLEIPNSPVNYNNKVFTFGPHNEFSEAEKIELFEKYPNNKENYQFAVEQFGKDFIESIWWTPYK